LTNSNKIIIFDLDDTLYNEESFFLSGIQNVAIFLSYKFKLNKNLLNNYMMNYFKKNGRNKIFNQTLKYFKIYTIKNLNLCIQIYRYSNRKIYLNNDSKFILNFLKNKNLYLVTDGNKNVQKMKIKLLNLNKYFKKIFITHNYGIHNSKPSIFCFKKICQLENTTFNNLVYIGDNPSKDFINLNKKKALTIRLLNGMHKKTKAKKNYDAKIKIKSLNQILNYL